MVEIIAAIIAEEADTMEVDATLLTIRTAEVTITAAIVEVDATMDTTKEVTMGHTDNNNVPRAF